MRLRRDMAARRKSPGGPMCMGKRAELERPGLPLGIVGDYISHAAPGTGSTSAPVRRRKKARSGYIREIPDWYVLLHPPRLLTSSFGPMGHPHPMSSRLGNSGLLLCVVS